MARFLGTLQEYPPSNIGTELPQMISTLLETTALLRAQKRERDIRTGVLNLISQGANERDIAGFVAEQSQPSYAPGALGQMHRIIDTATGGNVVTPTEQNVMNIITKTLFRDPLEQEYMRARIGATEALAEKRRAPKKTETAEREFPGDYTKAQLAALPFTEEEWKMMGRKEAVEKKMPKVPITIQRARKRYMQNFSPEERLEHKASYAKMKPEEAAEKWREVLETLGYGDKEVQQLKQIFREGNPEKIKEAIRRIGVY